MRMPRIQERIPMEPDPHNGVALEVVRDRIPDSLALKEDKLAGIARIRVHLSAAGAHNEEYTLASPP